MPFSSAIVSRRFGEQSTSFLTVTTPTASSLHVSHTSVTTSASATSVPPSSGGVSSSIVLSGIAVGSFIAAVILILVVGSSIHSLRRRWHFRRRRSWQPKQQHQNSRHPYPQQAMQISAPIPPCEGSKNRWEKPLPFQPQPDEVPIPKAYGSIAPNSYSSSKQEYLAANVENPYYIPKLTEKLSQSQLQSAPTISKPAQAHVPQQRVSLEPRPESIMTAFEEDVPAGGVLHPRQLAGPRPAIQAPQQPASPGVGALTPARAFPSRGSSLKPRRPPPPRSYGVNIAPAPAPVISPTMPVTPERTRDGNQARLNMSSDGSPNTTPTRPIPRIEVSQPTLLPAAELTGSPSGQKALRHSPKFVDLRSRHQLTSPAKPQTSVKGHLKQKRFEELERRPSPDTPQSADIPGLSTASTNTARSSQSSVTTFESVYDEETPPEETQKTLASPIPADQKSPISELRYPKIPRPSNQMVPRSPPQSQRIHMRQESAPSSLLEKRRGPTTAQNLEQRLWITDSNVKR